MEIVPATVNPLLIDVRVQPPTSNNKRQPGKLNNPAAACVETVKNREVQERTIVLSHNIIVFP